MKNGYYTYGEFRQGLQTPPVETHTVVDMRTVDNRQKPPLAPSPRKQKGKRRKGRRLAALVSIILVLTSALLLAADFMLPNGLTGYLQEAFAPQAPCVWAVSCGTYATLGEARSASDGVRQAGGAGFVAYDGQYHVLLSAYAAKDQAESVANKGNYTLYPILTQGMAASDLALAYRGKVKPLIGYHTDLYAKLYDLSDQLAQDGTTVAYCKGRVAAIRAALAQQAEAFLTAAESATDTPTANYRSGLVATLAALDNLAGHEDAMFLADLRWTYIMVLRINRL